MSGEKLSPSTSNDDKVAAAKARYIDLDEKRRAALAEIDNASFGCVASACPLPRLPHPASQLVPHQDLFGCRRWLLHRCVCGRVPLSTISNFPIATISSPSTSPPPCWVTYTVQVSFDALPVTQFTSSPPSQVESSAPIRISASRSLPPSELFADSSSSVGWLMLSVVRRCVRISSVVLVTLFAHQQSTTDGVELMIIIVATFGQALSGQAPAIHIIGVLVVWRFLVSIMLPQSSFENSC